MTYLDKQLNRILNQILNENIFKNASPTAKASGTIGLGVVGTHIGYDIGRHGDTSIDNIANYSEYGLYGALAAYLGILAYRRFLTQDDIGKLEILKSKLIYERDKEKRKLLQNEISKLEHIK